jgi:hypothetical protein
MPRTGRRGRCAIDSSRRTRCDASHRRFRAGAQAGEAATGVAT